MMRISVLSCMAMLETLSQQLALDVIRLALLISGCFLGRPALQLLRKIEEVHWIAKPTRVYHKLISS